MTPIEAYDKACEKWGDGVAWEVEGRFIVGRWVSTGETCGPYILESKTKAVEVMGEGKSWEEAFRHVG